MSEDWGRVLDELNQMRTDQQKILVAVTTLVEQAKDLPDHEDRIRSLEKWKYGLPVTGLVAVGSLAMSAWVKVSGKG